MPGTFTCLGGMMRSVAASVVPNLPVQADRTVVDGIDNCMDPDDLREQREALLATGSTINGLPILVLGENDVIGVGAFLMAAHGYGDFARALRQKFVIEISGVEPEGGTPTLASR